MNVGELIELLTEAAKQVPEGRDAEVRVLLCRGRDRFAVLTKAVSVDAGERVVVVEGHPHLDDDSTGRRPLTMGLDDELARLTAAPNVMPQGVPISVTVQVSAEKAYRFPLQADGRPLAPGDLEALRIGCLCDPERNAWAAAESAGEADRMFVVHNECPVHRTVTM